PPSRLQAGLPRELDKITAKALEKKRERRYQSARALCDDLGRLRQTLSADASAAFSVAQLARRPRITIPILLVIVALLAGGSWLVRGAVKARWEREQVLPHVMQLAEQNRNVEAFALAREAQRYIPNDPVLEK